MEFGCGEDALIKRTSAVLAAYEKANAYPLTGVTTLFAESVNSQARQAYSGNQQAVSQNLSQQQQRLRNEIQQQWQRIELQNLREQNRRPADFSGFPN